VSTIETAERMGEEIAYWRMKATDRAAEVTLASIRRARRLMKPRRRPPAPTVIGDSKA
jgi:hypothetical protein